MSEIIQETHDENDESLKSRKTTSGISLPSGSCHICPGFSAHYTHVDGVRSNPLEFILPPHQANEGKEEDERDEDSPQRAVIFVLVFLLIIRMLTE